MDYLIKKFIKNSEDINSPEVRSRYTYFAGTIGIAINFILFIIKISVGTFAGSIAIMADGFNNLTDTASSIITIIGVRLAGAPEDKEHPYGHGRIEYISALIVAALVMLVGFQLAWSSAQRILNPEPVIFNWISFNLLFISILLKLWLSHFNKKIGEKINSKALKAAGLDALGDVLISSTVLIAFGSSIFIPYNVDSIVGIGVAIFILYMSYKLIVETISPLLGEAPDSKLVEAIKSKLLSYPHILGVHDLIIHNYGVGKTMATIHVEFPASLDIMEIHEIIDLAERELSELLTIQLVIHMDPVSIETEEIKRIKIDLQEIMEQNPIILSMHDFRIQGKEPNKKISFDLVVDGNKLNKQLTIEMISEEVKRKLNEKHPAYHYNIVVDKFFETD